MAKKVVKKEVMVETVVPTKIQKVSVDFPREDLNNLARTVNELIDIING